MGGWKRIGIILSVVWFFGFGFFLLDRTLTHPSAGAEAYAQTYCLGQKTIETYKSDDWRQQDSVRARWDKFMPECVSSKARDYDIQNPSPDRTLERAAITALVADVVTIGLGWLIVWGCVAVVRWIRRGFVST
jgi:hypothetical protein